MKRGKGRDGFWVMSLTDEMDGVVVVAAIGLCVRDGEGFHFIQESQLVLT